MGQRSKKKKQELEASCRSVIAEGLINGLTDKGLVESLMAIGLSETKALFEVRQAYSDPLFNAARRISNRLAKRDWTLNIMSQLADGPCELAIPAVHNIDPRNFFASFYSTNRPVKLTGLIDHWPALKRWDHEYLEAKVGDAIVELQGQRSKADHYERAKDEFTDQVRMSEVLDRLREGTASNDYYVTAYNDKTNKQNLAELWADVGTVSLLEPSTGNDGYFWMGPRGTITPFHHDLTNNLLVQVKGRKLVRMVPPWESATMRNTTHCFSDWTLDEMLDESIDTPKMLECIIDAGEAIFLPVGWWHHVTALDETISMSFTNFAADNDFFSNYPADTAF